MSAIRKSHKGALKRFKVTASGKVRYRRSFGGHLLSGKRAKRRRKLHQPAYMTAVEGRKVREAMGL